MIRALAINNNSVQSLFGDQDGRLLNTEKSRFTCSTLAEAYSLYRGGNDDVPWAECALDGNEGTEDHIRNCFNAWNSASLPQRTWYITKSEANTCAEFFFQYDRLLMRGINDSDFAASRPSRPVENTLADGQSIRFDGRSRSYELVGRIDVPGSFLRDPATIYPYVRVASIPYPYDCEGTVSFRQSVVSTLPLGNPESASIRLFLIAGGAGVLFLTILGVRRAQKTKEEKREAAKKIETAPPVYEDDDEVDYTLLETEDTTVIGWRMWQHNSMSTKCFGRFVEIKADRFSLSDIYPVAKRGNIQGASLELYRSGTWRESAKVYDPQKITGLRLAPSKPSSTAINPQWGWATFTVVMDYGRSFVELNFIPGNSLKNEIGNFGNSDEGVARLISILSDAIRRRRDQAKDNDPPAGMMTQEELRALSEEHGIEVTFGDENSSSTSEARPSSNQGKKSKSDDPF